MVGEISFKGKTKLLADDVIKLKSSTEEQPKTGIKVMANKYDYYEKASMFRFTQDLISSNAKLSSLTTNLADIPDFDRDKFTYSIQVSAMETEITLFPVPEDKHSIITIDDEIVNVETGIVVPLKNMSEISSRTRIVIDVLAEDGVTTERYILNVEKQGGFLQGAVITANTLGTHHATIKVYRSDQYIDWKNTNSTELDEYELVAQTDTYDDGIFQLVLPIGKYDILIDKAGYLDYIVKGVPITQRNTYSIGNKQITPGDIIKDGIVKLTDKTAFLKAYGTEQGTEGYNEACDFVEDGIIKLTDQSIFLKNYGLEKTIETIN